MEAKKPVLWIVIPCYNEEGVLPLTAPVFLDKLNQMIDRGKVSDLSRICLVDDGSMDDTWGVIGRLAEGNPHFEGISLSRNRGHQNALLCGLMEARHFCDFSISIDCDGQDDVNAMDGMVDAFLSGDDVVYGVRNSREKDPFFKRFTAEAFYGLMDKMGVESVFNHADYRLLSVEVLDHLSEYGEVNLFLRGMVPLVGFKSSVVEYEREKRLAGESHYPLSKMLHLAIDGITSLSVKPIRLVSGLGVAFSALGLIGVIWAFSTALMGHAVAGWASTVCIVCLIGGVQLLSLGIIGEYVGKIYLEVKQRPRYIVAERTWEARGRRYRG